MKCSTKGAALRKETHIFRTYLDGCFKYKIQHINFPFNSMLTIKKGLTPLQGLIQVLTDVGLPEFKTQS